MNNPDFEAAEAKQRDERDERTIFVQVPGDNHMESVFFYISSLFF